MCTVTLVPLQNDDFVLISNRDEAPSRVSIAPEFYTYKNKQLLFPKDIQSNGTWIGLSEQNRLICLLNGGFEIHERKAEYRQSRGIVVKDLLFCDAIQDAIEDYELMDIEPFTMVIVDWNDVLDFYELVWDGNQKHFKSLEKLPHIWSSSTLYNEGMRQERRNWFQEFQQFNILNPESLFDFHQTAGKGNIDYGVIMDRKFVKTTSITRVHKDQEQVFMDYKDLKTNQHTTKSLNTFSRKK
ncbi:hypothetical protein C1T31_03865 [Hanstruepera neustonica]|uniref:NRDE family protein n=1 Tax=Hanstruepera neustonica TaxID=1445657 RepID=A0A2K1E4R8_9FLAO|nr:NRDE family protein [Hanstruepera neustonica]PNQ75278.1 hypothetical protein C1T31_03865 [Hanstruepera neustonica]